MSQKLVVTYQELLEDFIFSRMLRPETEKTYRKVIRKLQNTMEANNYDIHNLERHTLLNWRRKELDKGLASTSWNTYIRHLKAVFNHGIEYGLLSYEKNPFSELSVPVPSKKKKTLTDFCIIEARLYLNEMQRRDEKDENVSKLHPVWFWQVVFETFYYTGIRRNQLIHLRCMDINLKKQFINIRVEGSKTWREYQVPICEDLQPFLMLILTKAKLLGFTKEDQLFNVNRFTYKKRSNLTKEMTLDRLSNVFEYLSKQLGMRITPHRFRHTLGTELMKSPERNLHLVKDLLGHTNIRTTLEYVETDMNSIRAILDSRRSIGGQ